ncbi:MAG: hypothetical protein AB1428_08680 [Bacteroidota bacterium]
MKAIGIIVAFFGVVAFTKFYLAPPTSGDGRQVITNYVRQCSEGNMRLADFHQTAGREYILGGVRIYVMAFEGTVECTTDDPAKDGLQVEFAFDRTNNDQVPAMRAGERRIVRGAIQFEKTTYAWVGQPM